MYGHAKRIPTVKKIKGKSVFSKHFFFFSVCVCVWVCCCCCCFLGKKKNKEHLSSLHFCPCESLWLLLLAASQQSLFAGWNPALDRDEAGPVCTAGDAAAATTTAAKCLVCVAVIQSVCSLVVQEEEEESFFFSLFCSISQDILCKTNSPSLSLML